MIHIIAIEANKWTCSCYESTIWHTSDDNNSANKDATKHVFDVRSLDTFIDMNREDWELDYWPEEFSNKTEFLDYIEQTRKQNHINTSLN